MRVLICDDQPEFIEYLRKKITGHNPSITVYTSPWPALESETCFDIAFVDIEMEGINGFRLAKHIMGINKNCILVFFTSHGEFATRGYEIKAYRYILKTDPEHVIDRMITAAFKEYRDKNKKIQIVYKGEQAAVPINNICYIESFARLCAVHTEKAEYSMYKRLKDVYGELSQCGFIRCHKSYVVNLRCVRSINGENILLFGGETLPIGRSYANEVERAYANFETVGSINDV